jgi:2-(1,2-epoxy-1,2-dihydrophenyl)acetyl-CoA isomerase
MTSNQSTLSQTTVLYVVQDGYAQITLNRPEVLNALNQTLMQELGVAVQRASEDTNVRAVLITGSGRAFSSGADLTTIPTGSSSNTLGSPANPIDAGAALIERYNPVILGIRNLKKPVISAVNGAAAGAGMSIALAADIVLAGQSTTFLQAFARIGLVPDAGSTWFLPRLIGEQRARALTLLAEPLDAQSALQFGLVWKVYEDAELLGKAQSLAKRLANQATAGLALIKDALAKSPNNTLEQQLALEAKLQTQASKTADFYEGVQAFIEKRPAKFQGK